MPYLPLLSCPLPQLLSHGLSRQVATCHAAVTESYLAKEMWVKPAKRGGRGPRTVPLKALIDLPEGESPAVSRVSQWVGQQAGQHRQR